MMKDNDSKQVDAGGALRGLYSTRAKRFLRLEYN